MAVLFDNSGQSYTRAHTVPAGAWSMVMWVKPSAATSHGPFGFGSANAGGSTLFITVNGGVLKLVDLGSTSTAGLTLTTDVWHCIGLTVSAANAATYYYGTDPGSLTTATATGVQNPTGSQTIFIGSDSFDGDWWRGSLAAVKLWDAELNASEVAAELGSYSAVRTSGLAQAHPFLVAETTDYSGNANTLSGGVGASTDPAGPSALGGGGTPAAPRQPMVVSGAMQRSLL